MQYSKDNKCSVNIESYYPWIACLKFYLNPCLDIFIFNINLWHFSLSFLAHLEDLNKLFCPVFWHFLLGPEPQLLNAIMNLAL